MIERKRRDDMRRRQALNVMGIAGISAAAARTAAAQAGGTAERYGQTILPPEREKGQEKHVPMITAPGRATAGEQFTVTVEVGTVVPHPNTVEHHIKTIELYALADGSPYIVKAGTAELGPTVADPAVTFTIKLQNTSTLFALAYCNLHGVWDNQVRVLVG
jgi:superoxide reductase